ncbi:hypothetical protein QN345_00480 [Cryobacterium sp. 10I1]|uniref:hypothetical protein n=1 Tax=Cryobacterium sp. 10I1 TaxID=3048578 RepID=UPI002B226768|nr:hypothetical protein [Cryobacterium sp. 10I1]MEB0303815.1 hypothetical protein [Cryobacterium sp. 10I1]
MTDSVSARIEPTSLREVLARTREFSPKLATELRRGLRGVGDGIITAQKAILDGPLPPGVAKVGQRVTVGWSKKNQAATLIRRNIYANQGETTNRRSTGMREAIKKGLKTKVIAGKTRQGIAITTTKSAEGRKWPMSRTWNTPIFRHRIYGRDEWTYQKGQPYFFDPVQAGKEQARQAALEAITRSIEQITR